MQEINTLNEVTTHLHRAKRTSCVIMTDEARVLREMRIDKKLSMRALGAVLGKSDSYISQVENGRMDIPNGHVLETYLIALGGMTLKSFGERVRRFRLDRGPTNRDDLVEIAKRATDVQVNQILLLAKTILATHINL